MAQVSLEKITYLTVPDPGGSHFVDLLRGVQFTEAWHALPTQTRHPTASDEAKKAATKGVKGRLDEVGSRLEVMCCDLCTMNK